MAIALYGGSFDPIHIGHLITAQNVIENYDVEKVIFIPSHVTPLKNRKLEASDEDRLKMTYISTKNNNKFIISDYEIMKKDDVSYTYNTLKYFKEIYPEEKRKRILSGDGISLRNLQRVFHLHVSGCHRALSSFRDFDGG